MAVRVENGKVVLIGLTDSDLRKLSDAQFGAMIPMTPDVKAKMRGGKYPVDSDKESN